MNKRTILFFLIFLLSQAVSAQNPTLHFLLFLDTNDFNVGKSVEITYGRMTDLANKIAKSAELNKNITVIKGDELDVTKLDKTIEELKVNEKDVIFFYFAGHGWNNSQSEFPMLKMGGDGITIENSRGLEDIYYKLLEKKARMTFAFSEACNGSKSFKQKTNSDGEQDHIQYNINPAKVRSLFRQTKANVIMSSSKRGQLSYSNAFGGYFTNSFCKIFEKMTSKEYLEETKWENILDEIQENTREVSDNKQNPIINLEYYESANAPKKDEKCALNMTAFNKVFEDMFFLEKYWKDVLNYEKDYATETYEMFYQAEVTEFYDNLLNKLNLNNNLSDSEKKWFNDTAKEINDYLKTINKYKNDDAFRSKAFAKLSIPIDDLKVIHTKLDEIRKRCKE